MKEPVFNFSVFSRSAPVSKIITLGDDGRLNKVNAPAFSKGQYQRVTLPATSDGIDQLLKIRTNPACFITAGVNDGEAQCEAGTREAAKAGPAIVARTQEDLDYPEGGGLMAIDTDGYTLADAPEQKPLDTLEAAAEWIESVIPAPILGATTSSTSCGIVEDADHDVILSPDDRWHTLIVVKDATDIPRAIKALFARELIANRGFVMMGSNGALHIRTRVDIALASANQPTYGAPEVGPGLAHDPEIHLYDGEPLDTLAAIPPLTDKEKRQRDRIKHELKDAFLKQHAAAVAARTDGYIKKRAKDKGVSERVIRDQVERLAAGTAVLDWNTPIGDKTVAEVYANPDEYRGKDRYFADPFEPDYSDSGMVVKACEEGPGFYAVSLIHGEKRVYQLRCTPAYVESVIFAGFIDGKTTPEVKLVNTDALPEDWAAWLWCLDTQAERTAVVGKVKVKTSMAIGDVRAAVAAAKPPYGATGQAFDEDATPMTAEGLEVITFHNHSAWSATVDTFAHLDSRGTFFQGGDGHVCKVARSQPTTEKTRKKAAGIEGSEPVAGYPVEIVRFPKGVLRSELSKTVQYVNGGGDMIPIPHTVESDVVLDTDKRLNTLIGTSTLPVVTEDGIIGGGDTQGYDDATGMFLCVDPELRAVVPKDADCTFEAAQDAMFELMDSAFEDFMFEEEWAEFAGVCFMMMALCRGVLGGNMPAFIVDATNPGAGKTAFCDILKGIAGEEGVSDHLFPSGGNSEIEIGNIICANAIAGGNALYFDNVPADLTIDSPTISKVITSEEGFFKRVLGEKYQQLIMPLPVLFNGNGVSASKDMMRRTLKISVKKQPVGTPRSRGNISEWIAGYKIEGLRRLYTIIRFGQLANKAGHEHHEHLKQIRVAQDATLDGFVKFKALVAGPVALLNSLVKDDLGKWDIDSVKLAESNVCRLYDANRADDPDRENSRIALSLLLAMFGDRDFTASEAKYRLGRIDSHGLGLTDFCEKRRNFKKCNPATVQARADILELETEGESIGWLFYAGLAAIGYVDLREVKQAGGADVGLIGRALHRACDNPEWAVAGFTLMFKRTPNSRTYRFVNRSGYDAALWSGSGEAYSALSEA